MKTKLFITKFYLTLGLLFLGLSNLFSQYSTVFGVGISNIKGDISVRNNTLNTFILGGRKTIVPSFFVESTLQLARINGHAWNTIGLDRNSPVFQDEIFDDVQGFWFPRYQTRLFNLNISANYRIQMFNDKFFLNFGLGFGTNYSDLKINLKDENNQTYDFSGFGPFASESLFDDSYESSLTNRNNLTFDYLLLIGFDMYLGNNIFLNVALQANYSNSDLLDPAANSFLNNSDRIENFRFTIVQEF